MSRTTSRLTLSALFLLTASLFLARPALANDDARQPLIPQLNITTAPPNATFTVPTVPANGDVNPYGVAFVPRGFPTGGLIHPGDILVSNFNASTNVQGTGTTIVSIGSNGAGPSLFFQGTAPLGLTTALGVLRAGFVVVGSLPTDVNGNPQQGSLLVINKHGHLVKTLTDAALLDGPWDLTVRDDGRFAQVFVSNVLSGTVTRLDISLSGDGDGDADDHFVVLRKTQIASGYLTRPDPNALVVGPTGLALDAERDILYVASTGDNAVLAVNHATRRGSDAGKGAVVYQDNVHLHGPLALALTPNGDLISAQGDAVNPDPNQQNEVVEFTRTGHFVAQFSVDPGGPGGAFGLAVHTLEDGFIFATVDDDANTLEIFVVH
jgi:hypothetical protein